MPCVPPSRQARDSQLPMGLVQTGSSSGYARWFPSGPKVAHLEIQGYVDPPDQDCFSRDIGRSFQLGGRIYYVFGDTFCNDAGLSSNTIQVIPDRNRPREAYYLAKDGNGLVPPLIEINNDEVHWLKEPGNEGKRIALWCFGGVVEVTRGLGWTWYQKHTIESNGHDELEGVGLARISHNRESLTGELSCARIPGLMFDKHMPLFGSFSTLLEGCVVYLWGQKDADIYLARVHRDNCHLLYRYEFWDGEGYVFQWDKATAVLKDFQQGQVFRSELFGPQLPWVFIGVTRWADSAVMIGVASKIEGPWDTRPLFQAKGIKRPDDYQYCIYPHPWGASGRKGQLLVSWCDPWPGGMIMAKVTFDTHPRDYWATLALEGCSDKVTHAMINRATEICASSKLEYSELPSPRRLQFSGSDKGTVEAALMTVRHHMNLATKEEAAAARLEMRRGPSLSSFLARILDCGGGGGGCNGGGGEGGDGGGGGGGGG